MVDKTVNVNVDINATGLKPLVEGSAQVSENLKKASEHTKHIARAQQQARAYSAAQKAPSVEKDNESGLARGVGGMTGAAGRDFAKQSQGLGGLVHLYATFAANIFAATAAFGALSKAADTANMIKGLDQLGAASGRNLGSLSKRFVEATGYAISLQEAVQSVALASSSGMSTTNIERMAKVAEKASKALGRDMGDSVTRLTRGITKMEPELLDELGLMVRIDKAAADYARTIGKTVSQLTEFERRQAFANATLAQGEEKFGSIQLEANSYNKILANMKNLTQTGLELINKVLSPITELLSSSPTALGVAMAGIVTMLVKQAIPAIGQFRANAAEKVEKSFQNLLRIQKDYTELGLKEDAKAQALGLKQFSESIDTKEKISKARYSAIQGLHPATARASANKAIVDPIGMSDEDFNKSIKNIEKYAKVLDGKQEDIYKQQASNLRNHSTEMQKIRDEAFNFAYNKREENISRDEGLLAHATNQRRIIERTEKEIAGRRMVSMAAEQTATLGFIKGITAAWTNFKAVRSDKGFSFPITDENNNTVIKTVKNLNTIPAVFNLIKASATVTAVAVGTLVSALSTLFMVIGAVGVVAAVVDHFFDNSKRQAEALDSSIKSLDESYKALNDTLSAQTKADSTKGMTPESIAARATALSDFSDVVTKTSASFDVFSKSLSGWASFKEGFKEFFGFGRKSDISDSLGASIESAIKLIKTPELKKGLEDKLNHILDIDLSKSFNIAEDIKIALNKTKPEDYAWKLQAVSVALASVSKEINKTGQAASNLSRQLDTNTKVVNDIINSVKNTSNEFKAFEVLSATSKELDNALKDPNEALANMSKILANMETLSLLDPKSAEGLLRATSSMSDLNIEMGKTREKLLDLTAEYNKLNAETQRSQALAHDTNNRQPLDLSAVNVSGSKKELIDSINRQRVEYQKMLDTQTKQRDAFLQNIADLKTAFNEAKLQKLSLSFAKDMQEAANTIISSTANRVKSLGGDTSATELALAKEQIAVQMRQIDASVSLQISTEKLTSVTEELVAQRDLELAKQAVNSTAGSRDSISSKAAENLTAAQARYDKVKSNASLFNMSLEELTTLVIKYINKSKELTYEQKELLASNDKLVGIIASSAGTKAKLGAQSIAAEDTSVEQKRQFELKLQEFRLQNEQKILSVIQNQISEVASLVGEYSGLVNIQSIELEKAALQKQEQATTLKIISDIKKLNEDLASGKIKSEDVDSTRKFIVQKEAELAAIKADSTQKQQALDNKQFKQNLANELLLGTTKLDNVAKVSSAKDKLTQSELESESALLNLIGESNSLYKATIASLQAAVELRKTDLEYQRDLTEFADKRARTELKFNKDLASAEEAVKQARQNKDSASSDPGGVLANAYSSALAVQQQLQNNQQASIEALNTEGSALAKQYDSRYKILAITSQQKVAEAELADMLTKQAYNMQLLADATESLTKLFGDMGTNIGNSLSKFMEFTNSEASYAKEKETRDKEHYDRVRLLEEKGYDTTELKAKYEEDSAKAESKHSRDQLNNLTTIAGSTKKLFKEKTAAYKVLDAVEKTGHFIRLGNMIMEFTTKMGLIGGETTATIAADKAKEASMIPGIFGRFGQQLGVYGIAAAAAFIAAVGLSGGKHPGTPPKGSTAEDRQQVQGTGMQSWDSSGQRVKTGGGALGNEGDKSESIAKSIDYIEKYTFENLEYSNGMLNTLKSIEKNTANVAKATLTLPGTDIFRDDPNKQSGNFFSKTTKDTIDKGISIQGTIKDLIDQTGKLMTYVTNQTTKKNWFRTTTSTNTEYDNISGNSDLSAAISDTFKSGKTALVEAGKLLGKTGIESFVDGIQVDISNISAMGKTGTEFAEEVLAEIGIQLDKATASVFPEINGFRKLGESIFETISRLARDSQLVALAAQNMGMTIKEVSDPLQKVDLSQNLIELSGGIEKFVSQSKFFTDNFLTNAERIGITSAQLDVEFSKLAPSLAAIGQKVPTTREEFKNLIRSLDYLNDTTQQGLYTSLMNLAQGFSEVHTEVEATNDRLIRLLKLQGKTNEARDLEEANRLKGLTGKDLDWEKQIIALEKQLNIRNLETQLLEAQGDSYNALLAKREEELRVLSDEEREIKKKIYLAQDEKNARALEIQLMEAQGNSYDALLARREDELKGLSDTDKAIKKKIYLAQDEKNSRLLEIDLMEAQGYSYKALTARRKEELKGLSEIDKATKLLIYAAQDEKTTRALEIELMAAQGSTQKAVVLGRIEELKTLSPLNQALKKRIWQLKDEKALLDQKISQEVKIYELLGKSEEALRLTRQKELDEMDPQLQASQLYIYALEDEATLKDKLIEAYDSEKSKLKDLIGATKDFIKSVKEYKDSLLLSDKSTLTPLERYAEAKKQFDAISAIATSTAVTEAEKTAKNDAINKLPGISDTFLEASRTLYASSEFYTSDFKLVQSVVDQTITSLESQATTAELQLTELETHSTLLESIKGSVGTVADLLPKYLTAVENTSTAKTAAADAGSTAAGGTFTAPVVNIDYTDDLIDISNGIDLTNQVLAPLEGALSATATTTTEAIAALSTSMAVSITSIADAITKSTTDIVKAITDMTMVMTVSIASLASTVSSALTIYTTPTLSGSVMSTEVEDSIQSKQLTDLLTNSNISNTLLSSIDFTLLGIKEGMSVAPAASVAATSNDPAAATTSIGNSYWDTFDWTKSITPEVGGAGNYALGGIASGTSLVGENGPEMVDFKTPGRVYSNNNTSQILNGNNKELLQEIKSLREEVSKLRQEQAEQTGHMIQANYDANQKAANVIKDTQDAAANNISWNLRNIPKIA